jgi:hypothetical protein
MAVTREETGRPFNLPDIFSIKEEWFGTTSLKVN